MANEISLTASLSCFKSTVMASAIGRAITGGLFTMTGSTYIESIVSLATSATVIPLGSVTAPHWSVFHNLDSTNFLTIRNGVAGADVLKLLAGEWAFCPLLDTSTPYGVANTAAVSLEYVIFAL